MNNNQGDYGNISLPLAGLPPHSIPPESSSMSPTSNTPLLPAQTGRPPANEFVRKLYTILEKNAYPDIVRWTENGDTFVVLDTGKFTEDILPNHFNHSNFASFVRQLNKYDFHKIKKKVTDVERSWEFKHPSFRRHFDEGLDNIKRKPTTSKRLPMDDDALTGGGASISLQAQTEYILNNTVKKDNFNKLKKNFDDIRSELDEVKMDNANYRAELQTLGSKYNAMVESLLTFRTVYENLIGNFQTLCTSLNEKGIQVPTNLFEATHINGHSHVYSPNNANAAMNMMNGLPTKSVAGGTNSANIPSIQAILSNGSAPTQQQKPPIQSPTGSVIGPALPLLSTPTLPLATNGPQAAMRASIKLENEPNNEAQAVLRPGFHVLLVEDDAVSIRLCSKFLRKYGCTVEVVTDGLSAISTLEKFRYDLVLMDIVMPNLDGATATSIIRNFDNQTPIIAMTGNIEDQDLITYLQHGMNDILAKPFTKDDLHSMLIRYLKDRIPLRDQQKVQGTPGDDGQRMSISTAHDPSTNVKTPASTHPAQSGAGRHQSPHDLTHRSPNVQLQTSQMQIDQFRDQQKNIQPINTMNPQDALVPDQDVINDEPMLKKQRL